MSARKTDFTHGAVGDVHAKGLRELPPEQPCLIASRGKRTVVVPYNPGPRRNPEAWEESLRATAERLLDPKDSAQIPVASD